MKELDTMKQLKPHPYVIKLLGCVTESGALWLWGLILLYTVLHLIYSVTFSRQWKNHCFTTEHNKQPSHKLILSFFSQHRRS